MGCGHWEECKYGTTAELDEENVDTLGDYGLFEVYGCFHPETVDSNNGSIARLSRLRPSEELTHGEAKELRRQRNEDLRVCESCEHYES
ncbi:MAG: hypothetical protein ABEK36_04500 [Candidatus Aenigmatarchaeota archaeon]